jgi:GTP-binding protein EngB required for normal cell division
MSPAGTRAAKSVALATDELRVRTGALEEALELGSAELDPAAVNRARSVVGKVSERITLAGEHTVVALAGATGSGKSSLFNALVGADVSKAGARRPTTSTATAAIWGDTDAGALLDWLKVDSRHLVRSGPGGQALDGLVLLDLPDFDSREASHRVEAERLLELVDAFVWVTDPQKYADARLHDDFVRLLSQHQAVTLAVLNQADLLPEGALSDCVADLRGLLARDGIADATVLATSARTGAGMHALAERIATRVEARNASRQRLTADVITVARMLRDGVGDGEAHADRLPRQALDSALARAAGVPIVLDAVRRDYRRAALARTGWLFSRWVGRRGPDPLRRLRLARAGELRPGTADLTGTDARAALQRSSIATPSLATRSAVEVAARGFVQQASEGLPDRWARAVERTVEAGSDELPDALDQAVLATPLRFRRPLWWSVANVFHWLLGLAAVVGALWLGGLHVLGLLALPRPETPAVGVVPVPLLLLVGGALLGMLLAGLARWLARLGARRRTGVAADRLRASIAEVTAARVVRPVAAALDRHRATREQLDRAAR